MAREVRLELPSEHVASHPRDDGRADADGASSAERARRYTDLPRRVQHAGERENRTLARTRFCDRAGHRVHLAPVDVAVAASDVLGEHLVDDRGIDAAQAELARLAAEVLTLGSR